MISGDLAPDGKHWFTQDADQFAVFDSDSGSRHDLSHPGFAFAAPYRWLGDDTIALALRTTGDETVPLLTCRVSTNACTAAVADVGPAADVVVPNGPTTGDAR